MITAVDLPWSDVRNGLTNLCERSESVLKLMQHGLYEDSPHLKGTIESIQSELDELVRIFAAMHDVATEMRGEKK